MSTLNNKKIKYKSGFTLIELMVTIVIFVIITGVVIISQNKFDNGILLDNLAYDMAISIRQAQTFGVNTRESFSGTDKFVPYGIYFNRTLDNGNRYFTFFTDSDPITNKNSKYDGDSSCPSDGTTECVQKYTIKRGSYISSICTSESECSSNPADELTILFERPNPDAKIYVGSGGRLVTDQKPYAKITVSSADSQASRSIVVTNVGQIYVVQ